MAETKADLLSRFAQTLEDGLIPKATQLLSGTTDQFPLFIGPTDPSADPDLLALIAPGSPWTDTSVGPIYPAKLAVFDEGVFQAWVPWGFVGTDGSGGFISIDTSTSTEDPAGLNIYLAAGKGSQEASVGARADGRLELASTAGATLNDQILGTQAADVGAAGTAAEIIAALRASRLMAATPDSLAFDQQPTGALVDATITPAVTVQILDDLGTLCAFDNVTEVTVELTVPGGATLEGTLTQTAVNGVATFDDLSVDTAGIGYTLTASSGALTPAVSDPFTISAP